MIENQLQMTADEQHRVETFSPLAPDNGAAALLGHRVVVSQDALRYALPKEVAPGVPWPAGFRDEINAWSRSFFGITNIVRDGECYFLGDTDTILVNPRTAAALASKTRSQKLRDAGFTRRPSWRSLPSDE